MEHPQSSIVLRAEHIVKKYGPVTALSDVSIRLQKGEVLGLLGDNGAGKSTLIKILTGFLQPTEGKIFVNEQEVRLRSVTHARSLGIETVYQDLALVNEMTVYHNMFLNRELTYAPLPLLNNEKCANWHASIWIESASESPQSILPSAGSPADNDRPSPSRVQSPQMHAYSCSMNPSPPWVRRKALLSCN